MQKPKKKGTLTQKVVMAWMMVVIISNVTIGSLCFVIYRDQLYDARAAEAQNVAMAMALRIDGDEFTAVLETMEKNDYWHQVKDYADHVSIVFDTAFIYILDAKYTDEVTYFAEGAPGDSPYDLGMTEIIEDVYADEMFDTIATGEPTCTEPYASGDYGDMVSGFAAITDASGKVVGVVGVDFFFENIRNQLLNFAGWVVGIVLAFCIGCYFLMNFLGTKLAGRPLTDLDYAAQKLAVGDMDISFDIHSTTEIGRLADSFILMIDGIKTQVAILEALSRGDLSVDVKPRSPRDTMGQAIAQILVNLNNMFGEIDNSAAQVSAGARQISDSAQNMAQGTSEQANAIEQLSAAIGDVTEKAKANLEVAAKTNNLTASIKSDAQTGSEHMNRMTHAVKDITDASTAIGKVIKVIDDIAFQTNILALNAAVEAARAGQHGKGFAVVAEEVRNLAAKSAEAAKNTEHLISDSMEKAKFGATIANETADSLTRIIEGINECADLVNGIAGSFDEQIQAMVQINQGVEQVSHVVQQNSATAQESAAASRQMSDQSVLLEGLVSNFKLKDSARRSLSQGAAHRPSSLPPASPPPSSDRSGYGKY